MLYPSAFRVAATVQTLGPPVMWADVGAALDVRGGGHHVASLVLCLIASLCDVHGRQLEHPNRIASTCYDYDSEVILIYQETFYPIYGSTNHKFFLLNMAPTNLVCSMAEARQQI